MKATVVITTANDSPKVLHPTPGNLFEELGPRRRSLGNVGLTSTPFTLSVPQGLSVKLVIDSCGV